MKLRDYQIKAVNDISSFFKKNKKRAVVTAPTGSGKTVIFTHIAKKVQEKGKKILILTDRVELLMQANGSLKKVGLQAFLIQAGIKYVSNTFSTYVAMSQTLRNRLGTEYWDKFLDNIDLIIIDEAHKQEFNYIFEFIDKKHFVLGFTATPKRSGKMRQLALDYDNIIETISVKKLIERGFLVADDYFGFGSPDLSNVEYSKLKGDYKESSLFQKFNSPQVYAGAVENYQKLTPNTKTLIFCVNIEHCIKTCLEFKKQGFKAKFITSNVGKPKEPKKDDAGSVARYEEKMRIYKLYQLHFKELSGKRTDIFKDFEDDKFDILINAGIATTGYDCPSIETVVILRATLSVTLWLQMLGRGSRIYENKTHFNILDFGGNAARLGNYSEERAWHLWHEESKGGGLPPLKECGFKSDGSPIKGNIKGCRRLILAAYKICSFCGFKYPEKKAKKIELSLLADNIKFKSINAMTDDELYKYWKHKGHKTAWLWRQLWIKNGEAEIKKFARKYHWSSTVEHRAIDFCKKIFKKT